MNKLRFHIFEILFVAEIVARCWAQLVRLAAMLVAVMDRKLLNFTILCQPQFDFATRFSFLVW